MGVEPAGLEVSHDEHEFLATPEERTRRDPHFPLLHYELSSAFVMATKAITYIM